MMTCKEFEKTEKDFITRRERMKNIGGEYSKVILNDFDITLALMQNVRTSATIQAVRNTTVEKLRAYITKIGEKIEQNQKVIDSQYKQKEKESIDNICAKYQVEIKFTNLRELEETIATIKKDIVYNPYEEIYAGKTMDKLIAALRAQNQEYAEKETAERAYRKDFDIIADGLEDVQKRREEQNKGIKLDKGILLDIFRGDFRDQIVRMVSANSELYYAAYSDAYGKNAAVDAARRGFFTSDIKMSVQDVDIVTRFLLKVTGIEEEITDAYKIKSLSSNRFVRNNTYEVLKGHLDALEELRSEYLRLKEQKAKKDAFLQQRRDSLPVADAPIEEQKIYIRRFAGEDNSYQADYDKEVIVSSELSKSLGNNDGQDHFLENRYYYAMEDFEKIVKYYNSLVNLRQEFINNLSMFANPIHNQVLTDREKLLSDIAALDQELASLEQDIRRKEARINDIVPKTSGVVTKAVANLTRGTEIRDLRNELQERKEEYEACASERRTKYDYELAQINAKLVDEFNRTFAPYLDLLAKWGYNVDLDFILGYDKDALSSAYDDEIENTKQTYKNRVKLILDELAKQSNTSDNDKMYELARARGVDMDEPTLLVVDALQNFIGYLQNASAKDSINSEGFLKFVTQLTEIGVEITGPDLDKIIGSRISVMDANILSGEDEIEEVAEVEEPSVAEELDSEIPLIPETQSDFAMPVPVVPTESYVEPISTQEETPENTDELSLDALVAILNQGDGFNEEVASEAARAFIEDSHPGLKDLGSTQVLPDASEAKPVSESQDKVIDVGSKFSISLGSGKKPKLFDFDAVDDDEEDYDDEQVVFKPNFNPEIGSLKLGRTLNLPPVKPTEE